MLQGNPSDCVRRHSVFGTEGTLPLLLACSAGRGKLLAGLALPAMLGSALPSSRTLSSLAAIIRNVLASQAYDRAKSPKLSTASVLFPNADL